MSSQSSWRIEIKPSAVKALRRLPRDERDRLIAAMTDSISKRVIGPANRRHS